MEPNKPVAVGRKLWSFLRVAFFMMRKGLISKRKLVMDMNLMMKMGRITGKSWAKNLASGHQHVPPGIGLQEYEMSCGSSPNPVFFRAKHAAKRRHHTYFPCIGAIVEDDADAPSSALPSIEYSPRCFDEKFSPQPSPLSVVISNYSDHENDEIDGNVDGEAEEFIRRFYEQLRIQNSMQLLP